MIVKFHNKNLKNIKIELILKKYQKMNLEISKIYSQTQIKREQLLYRRDPKKLSTSEMNFICIKGSRVHIIIKMTYLLK